MSFRNDYTKIALRIILIILIGFAGDVAAQNINNTGKVKVDSSATPEQEFLRLRGIETAQADHSAALRTAANLLLFVPRTVVNGLLHATGYGPHLIDDYQFIEKIDDFFHIYKQEAGWSPVLDLASGPTLAYGATLFYRKKPFGISAGGFYSSSAFWKTKVKLRNAFLLGRSVLKVSLSGSILTREDYRFYGFGPDPDNDPRNVFQSDARDDFGVYEQRLSRAQWVLGLRPSPKWQLFYTGYYQQRKTRNPRDHDSDNIENTFNLDVIPGIRAGQSTIGKQVYNEFTVRFDSRQHQGQISPGVRLDGYVGLSEGVGSDDSRFTRAGGSAAIFIPVIKHNRLIVPRVVFDAIDNRNDRVPISFAEYPRQPTFRGISSNRLLRTDKISLVPSLEYQWPLAYTMAAHLFIDYLLVGDSLGDLTFNDAPYAIGFGIDVHSVDSELVRISISDGSEGFRFKITVGLSGYNTARSEWQ